MEIYLQGLTMGLAYVAPIGLQNLFVINTALTQRKSRVYATALIVIFFDVTLGLGVFLWHRRNYERFSDLGNDHSWHRFADRYLDRHRTGAGA